MRGALSLNLVCLFLFGPVPGSPAAADSKFTVYSGKALGPKGEFLYGEHHVLRQDAGRIRDRVVLYLCADGAPFARKTAHYVNATAPDFVLEDSSNGVREGVRSEGPSRTVFFRAGLNAAEKSATLTLGANSVIDAGFDEFVRQNWQPLMAGQTLSFYFLVPSRLSGMDFQLRRLDRGHDGSSIEKFRLEGAGLLKWVAPSIDVSYSADDRELVRYEGLSGLRDQRGENLRAIITFRTADRHGADAAEFTAALRAQLAPCRG